MDTYLIAEAHERLAALWQSESDYAADAPAILRVCESLLGAVAAQERRIEDLQAELAAQRAPVAPQREVSQ